MKNGAKILLVLSAVVCCGTAMSQTDDDKFKAEFEAFKQQAQTEFNTFKHDAKKEYDEFRRKANEEYANFMATPWTFVEKQEAVDEPKQPKPPAPQVKEPEAEPEEEELAFEIVLPMPEEYTMPEPSGPIEKTTVLSQKPLFEFSYFNTRCRVDADNSLMFKLADISEKTVAETWKNLSGKYSDALIVDCLKLRKDMQLCDWGYITLLDTIATSFFGSKSNEAVLLQVYILTQSGYNVRIAKTGSRLVMLVPTLELLYSYSYLTLDDKKYYVIDDIDADGFKVFNHAFPREKILSIRVNGIPRFAQNTAGTREFVSEKYPDLKLSLGVNKNLVDFYNTYPISDWNNYASASLSAEVKDVLYPMLKKHIAGKTQEEAANMLIDFVQTAFEYKVDDEQFGYERPLFADETFYYPYSDCEDRSILFFVLVRELLGLDVVLLNYPGHLATAVHFTDDIAGDYMTIDNKKYIVCDPTYIGATIGDAMPQYKNEKAKIVRVAN